ncbi:MAG: cobalamin biosynthesis protein [Candidatus Omnitrophota bacterium]|nr:cobalamin biosynthesis protein [Candidatus Omnitrophota bacterium]
MRVAIVAITKKGKRVALKIKRNISESKVYVLALKGGLRDLAGKLFSEFEGIVFCMAAGIVIRVIAPYIDNKYTDPAVVTVDEGGRFAISLLSGHEGGANNLAILVANSLGAQPVITTASESRRNIVIGIGCRRGIKKGEILKAVRYALTKTGHLINRVKYIATIDLKQNEQGIRDTCTELRIPLRIVSLDLVKKFSGIYERSSFVKEKIGVEGVSEPCALIAAKRPKLILPKTIVGRVTVAVAKEV